MSQDLTRAFGKKFIYKGHEFLRVGQFFNGLDDSDTGPDHLVYYDSDRNMYFGAVKKSNGLLGLTIEDYQTRKLTYKRTYDSDLNIDQDLMNGFNIKNRFDDKSELYDVGNVIPLKTLVIVEDSEGVRVWRKDSEDGSQKSHFTVFPEYMMPHAGLRDGSLSWIMRNQKNPTNVVFNPYLVTGKAISFKANNFLTQNTSPDRVMYHGKFDGIKPGIIVTKVNGVPTSIIEFLSTSQDSESTNDDGVYYHNVLNDDSDEIIMSVADDISLTGVSVQYINEYGDSELDINEELYISEGEQTLPEIALLADSDIVTTSYTSHHTDSPPWHVFADSDNTGFKANLGAIHGHIGIQTSKFEESYVLKNIIITNTPDVLAPNRPADFMIQRYDIEFNQWYIVEQVTGFDGYVYNKTFDSEYAGQGFRVVFQKCQPDFDSDVNALEVKQITFNVEKRRLNMIKKNRSFFVTNTGISYKFILQDSETVSGLFVGAGGGGGGGGYGAGGGGASAVEVTELKLNPGTYSLRVGAGGTGGASGGSTNDPGNTGGVTYFLDETNVRTIIQINGATGGDAGYEQPAGTYNDPDYFGSAGGVSVDNVNYQITSTTHFGANGSFQDGIEGNVLDYISYKDETTVDNFNTTFGSGGAGKASLVGGVGTQATHAGRPSSFSTTRNAVSGSGAGGGGAAFELGQAPGGDGGSGWISITFK